jgi:hypothetical protein
MWCGVLVSVFVEGAVGEGEDVRFEGFEEFEVLILFLFKFHDEFWVGEGVLSMRVLSCGFLLSVIMGSSLAISSTS